MPSYILIDSSDRDELAKVWGSSVQPSVLTIQSPSFQAVISGVKVGCFSVYSTQVKGSYHLKTTKISGDYILATLVDGFGSICWPGKSKEFQPLKAGSVVLAVPGTDCEYRMSETLAVTVGIRPRNADLLLMKALPFKLRNEVVGVLPELEARDIRQLSLFLTSEIERCKVMDESAQAYVQILLDALAARFSLHLRQKLGPERGYSPTDLAIALKCDEIIVSGDPLVTSVKDLAQAAGWSERHVYRAFDEVCNCTPSDFIKRVRLFRAWSRLKFPSSPSVSQSELATEAGYKTLRGFQRDYLHEFSEEP
jgi:AraC-like DNA-binding protein